ncbi:MAG: hypothetical protein WDO16_05335 [Bacteroidota bacterium]
MLKKGPVSHFATTTPLFLFLLPVFFVLHEFTGNYSSVPATDAVLLVFLYIGSGLLIAGFGWLFYRHLIKACLAAFFLLAYHFFFGSIQDTLKSLFSQAFISQYRFILPVSFFIFLAILTWLKKRKKPLLTLTYYLNILLLIFIVFDAGRLVAKMARPKKDTPLELAIKNFTGCDTCSKPDIYFILLDQYAGHTALKEVFNFDNTRFENELNRRGFHIANNSSSNYNLTPFSMASALNMEYLSPEMGVKKHLNVGYSYQMIRNSQVVKFLTACGYRFYNHSVFDFPGQPAHEYGAFLPYGILNSDKAINMNIAIMRAFVEVRKALLRHTGLRQQLKQIQEPAYRA